WKEHALFVADGNFDRLPGICMKAEPCLKSKLGCFCPFHMLFKALELTI
ncbi:hypothetical protein Tco_1046790, partial [Tanacetum coccineum]